MSEDLNYAGDQDRLMFSSLKIHASLLNVKGRKRQVEFVHLQITYEIDCSEFIQKCQLKPTFLQPNSYYFPINCTAVASGNI